MNSNSPRSLNFREKYSPNYRQKLRIALDRGFNDEDVMMNFGVDDLDELRALAAAENEGDPMHAAAEAASARAVAVRAEAERAARAAEQRAADVVNMREEREHLLAVGKQSERHAVFLSELIADAAKQRGALARECAEFWSDPSFALERSELHRVQRYEKLLDKLQRVTVEPECWKLALEMVQARAETDRARIEEIEQEFANGNPTP